jgi:mRNA-degrading endonuclease RelE of RelBE toxin-antitoxin system
MAYEICFRGHSSEELRSLRVFEQRQIVAEIEEQLRHEPTGQTRNRKCLLGLTPSFEHRPPVWELRIGDIRVFYDVDQETLEVSIRAIRRKGPSQTTEEIT